MRKQLESAIMEAVTAVRTLNFADPQVYAWWLSQAYYFVRHSTPMLALSAGLSVENRPYHLRCIDHLSEEKGHDKMLLNDLKILGRKIEEFPELEGAMALYQTQYFWIQHKSPMSFLGYIVILEGLAIVAGPEVYRAVKPTGAVTFLGLHTEEDEDHIEKAYQMIEALPAKEQELALANAKLTAFIYKQMVGQIQALTVGIKTKAA